MSALRRSISLLMLAALTLGSYSRAGDAPTARGKRIAFLTSSGADVGKIELEHFLSGLRHQGLIPGRDVEVIEGFASHDFAQLPDMVRALLDRRPDVLVTTDAGATLAAVHATDRTPVVFSAIGDPVGNGMVASLAHPGGNVTGVATNNSGLGAKRLELLKDAFPGTTRVAVLFHAKYMAECEIEIEEVEAAARKLRLELVRISVPDAQGLERAFDQIRRARADALYVPTSPVSNNAEIVRLARVHRLPAVYDSRAPLGRGGLMSYGTEVRTSLARAARYAAQILAGAHPSTLPVETLERVNLVVNLKEARDQDVKLPQAVLLRADEFIE
jgi:putative ABC transport system substrate-binding protein